MNRYDIIYYIHIYLYIYIYIYVFTVLYKYIFWAVCLIHENVKKIGSWFL